MAAPTDRVQVLKQESTAIGGQDADARDYPVPLNSQQDAPEVMGVFFQDASNRDETTYIARAGNNLLFRDGANPVEKTLTDLLAAGSGHEALDTLVHDVAETSYVEVTRSSGQVSNVTIWETAAKLKKVREAAVTRASGQVSVVVETQYDAAGVAIAGQVLTHTVTRSGGQVASIATVQT